MWLGEADWTSITGFRLKTWNSIDIKFKGLWLRIYKLVISRSICTNLPCQWNCTSEPSHRIFCLQHDVASAKSSNKSSCERFHHWPFSESIKWISVGKVFQNRRKPTLGTRKSFVCIFSAIIHCWYYSNIKMKMSWQENHHIRKSNSPTYRITLLIIFHCPMLGATVFSLPDSWYFSWNKIKFSHS